MNTTNDRGAAEKALHDLFSDDIALVHLHGRPQIPGQAVPVPEQYSIQTLIGIRQGDGWHFTFFQNTLIQQERSS